jgi:hypothetical protein
MIVFVGSFWIWKSIALEGIMGREEQGWKVFGLAFKDLLGPSQGNPSANILQVFINNHFQSWNELHDPASRMRITASP